MDHCVYCGAVFPPDFKQGVQEPEALKWIERPTIPAAAARQLEMMKVVPLDRDTRPRSLAKGLALISLPLFGGIFLLLYLLLQRYSAGIAVLVLVVAAVFLVYLVWSVFRSAGRT